MKETREPRELRFVFPKCGATWLQTRNESCVNVDHVYDDGHVEWGFIKHEEIMEYNCGACGYIIVDKDGQEVVAEDLGEWLMAHCSQDEPDAGQSEDHDSEVPPSESDK